MVSVCRLSKLCLDFCFKLLMRNLASSLTHCTEKLRTALKKKYVPPTYANTTWMEERVGREFERGERVEEKEEERKEDNGWRERGWEGGRVGNERGKEPCLDDTEERRVC